MDMPICLSAPGKLHDESPGPLSVDTALAMTVGVATAARKEPTPLGTGAVFKRTGRTQQISDTVVGSRPIGNRVIWGEAPPCCRRITAEADRGVAGSIKVSVAKDC